MTTCQRNFQRDFAIPSEPDKLSAPNEATAKRQKPTNIPDTTISGSLGPALGFPESDPVPKSTLTPKLASTAIYTEVDLQWLLRICMGAKKTFQKPYECLLKVR